MFGLTEWRKTKFYQEVREEAREELKQEVKEEVKQEVKEEIKQEVKEEVKQEVKEEVKQEVKQEVEEETKIGAIPRLLKMGFSAEQIAEALELKVEVVKQVIEQQGGEES